MAQYGKLSGTVTLANGNADSGATVTIRKQGAFVTSTQAGPAYTVNDPGGIIVGDTVVANTTTTPQRVVSVVSATGITAGALGLGTLADEDRISPTTAVTIYNDAQGTETKTNPVTTNASGYWYAWAPIVPYDIIIQKSDGSAKVIKYDVLPEGQELVESNIYPQAASVPYRRGVSRTHTQGRLATWENPTGTIKVEFDWNGDIISQGDLTVVDITASGNVNVTGDLTVDDITMDDLIADDISVGDLTVSGAVSLPAGSLETADLAAGAVTTSTISTGTTDQTFTAAAGFTAVVGDGPGAVIAVTITPFSTDSVFEITAYVPCQSAGAAASHLFARIRHSGSTLHEAGCVTSAGAGDPGNISLMARQTGLSGAQTWSLECDANVADMSVLSSTTSRKAKLMVKEFKK